MRGGGIEGYVQMWPRALFERLEGEREHAARLVGILAGPGVYVLYRDDEPYYVGKAKRLESRLFGHARRPGSAYHLFWNYFSVFAVKDEGLRNTLEAVLIAAMPTANNARPKLPKVRMPRQVIKLLHEINSLKRA